MPLTIADLPFEMLENVASHLHRKSDLLSLSLACKALQSPCMMQMFRTVDIQFIVNKRELDTTIADAILPAMTAVAPDSTSGSEVTNGSLVKSLRIGLGRIGLGTTDDIVEDEDFEDGEPVYYQFQRSEPAQSTLAAASCFLHWVADLLCACPNLSTLRMDVPHFSARLAHLLRGRMGDVAVAAAGLRTLRYVSCSDSNLGFRGRGHAVWHRTLLLHRFAGLTSLSLQFESMSPDTLLFWESSLTRPTNLIHLKLQYEGYASYSGSRRMIQFTCRAITGSPRLQRLSLTGPGGSGNFPITADVMAAVASRPQCKELHLTSIGHARLDQEALDHLRAATNLRCVSIYHAGNFKSLLAFLAHLPPDLETLDLGECGGGVLLEHLADLLFVATWCPRLSTLRLFQRAPFLRPSQLCAIPEFTKKVAAARGSRLQLS